MSNDATSSAVNRVSAYSVPRRISATVNAFLRVDGAASFSSWFNIRGSVRRECLLGQTGDFEAQALECVACSVRVEVQEVDAGNRGKRLFDWVIDTVNFYGVRLDSTGSDVL